MDYKDHSDREVEQALNVLAAVLAWLGRASLRAGYLELTPRQKA
jgi:hypothetical protein